MVVLRRAEARDGTRLLRLVAEDGSATGTVEDLAERFATRAAEHDRAATFPHANFRDVAETGFAGLTVPRSLGGAEAGLHRVRAVVGRLAMADPSTALILAMQFVHHVGIASSTSWPRHLTERVQSGAVKRGELVNVLRVEPELGSPARGGLPATTARQVPSGWAISGRKIYSTGSTGLAYGLVWARTDDDDPRVGLFLVPMDTDGVRIEDSWDAAGMRSTASHDVVFENVFVPADHAVDLRPPSGWSAGDPTYAAWNTTLISAVYDGVARSAQAWLRAFLRERVPTNLGRPLAELPRFQELVGENERLLFVNETLLDAAATAVDAGRPLPPSRSGLVKASVTENAIAVVQRTVEASGNHGLSRANPLERHLRDVLCARIHTPQGDSVRLAAGRLALGL
jgi:alkylation response protein AidB-like acyl-CoA dehydrogenase